MAERIKELEAKREQHRAQMEEMEKLIEEQNAQMAAKDSMVEAHFYKLEAMIFKSMSSRFVPDVTQHMTHPDKHNAIFVLFLFFFC
jgi:Tfp pilus assembly protein FimV